MSVCSCGAQIVWARTTTGQRMPLDPTPVPDGNVVYCGEKSVRVLAAGETAGGWERYHSHWSNCDDANAHRVHPGQGTLDIGGPE